MKSSYQIKALIDHLRAGEQKSTPDCVQVLEWVLGADEPVSSPRVARGPRLDKAAMLAALADRRRTPPEQINNASLYAGSEMYFYCVSCGALSAVLPEGYIIPPPKLCTPCSTLKLLGWLE